MTSEEWKGKTRVSLVGGGVLLTTTWLSCPVRVWF